MLTKILIKGRGNFYLIDGEGTNYLGKDSHYAVYGDKQFPFLRDGCEVLIRKNNKILKRIKSYK